MATIALIQSGSEIYRQPYADVESFVRRCCFFPQPLYRGLEPLTFQAFTDDDVDGLLSGLDRDLHACLIFASNALASTSVVGAVAKHESQLRQYISAGGGIVLLHQMRNSPPKALTEGLGFEVANVQPLPPAGRSVSARVAGRRFARSNGAEAHGGRTAAAYPLSSYPDVLLAYPEWLTPTTADHGDSGGGLVDEPTHATLRWKAVPQVGNPKRLFWHAIPAAKVGKLSPVLTGDDRNDIVLARTSSDSGMRCVVSTVPLDWLGEAPLLRNIISYSACGIPAAVIWGRSVDRPVHQPAATSLAMRGLSQGRTVAFRAVTDDIGDDDRWLLRETELSFVTSEHFARLDRRARGHDASPEDTQEDALTDALLTYLDRGGTVASIGDSSALDGPRSTSREPLQAWVGPFVGRRLGEHLLNALATVTEWGEAPNGREADPFALRNIVRAVADIAARYGESVSPPMSEAKRARVVALAQAQLALTHDVGSATTRAETLALVCTDTDDLHSALNLLSKHRPNAPIDVQCQLDAAALAVRHALASSADGDSWPCRDSASTQLTAWLELCLTATDELSSARPDREARALGSPIASELTTTHVVRLCSAASTLADVLTLHPGTPSGDSTQPSVDTLATSLAQRLARALPIPRGPQDQATRGTPGAMSPLQLWLSVEATAEIVAGLLALSGRRVQDDVVLSRIEQGTQWLRVAFNRYSIARDGIGPLSRVIQTLIRVEQEFPSGLYRLALPKPEGSQGEPGWPPATPTPALATHLRRHNEQLRTQYDELRDATERLGLAARCGRIAVTFVLIGVFIAAIALGAVSLVFLGLTASQVFVPLAVILVTLAVWFTRIALRAGLVSPPLDGVLASITLESSVPR